MSGVNFTGRVQRADTDAWVDLATDTVVTYETTAAGTVYVVRVTPEDPEADPATGYELFRGVQTGSEAWAAAGAAIAADAVNAAGETVGKSVGG